MTCASQVISAPARVLGETWRATFPLSDQEQANLRAYAQDVAAIQGSGGNRLRLDLCLLWLGAADYTRGTPATSLGYSNITAVEYTSRVELTTDKVIAAVQDVTRPDGLRVVDSIFFLGEVMLDEPTTPRPNEAWLILTHYPRFVARITAAGFKPSMYFNVNDTPANLMDDTFVDARYPALDGHRSMFWVYRSLLFLKNHGLPLPQRIAWSWYINSTQPENYSQLLARTLDDADATLLALGAPRAYGAAESSYFQDPAQRRSIGQAFASEAAKSPRFQRVCFWTTPDGGGPGVNVAFPFAFEDYFPPP